MGSFFICSKKKNFYEPGFCSLIKLCCVALLYALFAMLHIQTQPVKFSCNLSRNVA